jgi:hypothetical protein
MIRSALGGCTQALDQLGGTAVISTPSGVYCMNVHMKRPELSATNHGSRGRRIQSS